MFNSVIMFCNAIMSSTMHCSHTCRLQGSRSHLLITKHLVYAVSSAVLHLHPSQYVTSIAALLTAAVSQPLQLSPSFLCLRIGSCFSTATKKHSLSLCRYGMPGPLETRVAMMAAASASLNWPTPQSNILTVYLTVDEAAQAVSLSTSFVANPAAQPFVVTPSTAVVRGNGSTKFTVAICNPDAMMHEGYLLAAQRVIAPESRVALHCIVTEEGAAPASESSNEEEVQASSQAAAGVTDPLFAGLTDRPFAEAASAHESDAPLQSQQQSSSQKAAQRHFVSCQLSGGFHPYAGSPSTPLLPLKVQLRAAVIQPYLEAEFADAADSLSFICHATHDPSQHSSYRQTVTLTNMHSCPVQFAVSLAGAVAGAGRFQIIRAVCSSVSQLQGLQPKPLLASLQSRRVNEKLQYSAGEDQHMLRLRPHEHVSVCVQYMPLQLPTTQTGASSAAVAAVGTSSAEAQTAGSSDTFQDESADDQLIITYSNGHSQTVAVHAQRLQPVLHSSAAQLDFGPVHMQSPKTLEVELSNPSLVDAAWSVQLEADSADAGAVASVTFAQGSQLGAAPDQAGVPGAISTAGNPAAAQQGIAGSAAFVAVPCSGVLLGRGLSMPQKQKISVMFSPKQAGPCTAVLRVAVAAGSPIDIAVSGEGTYSQRDEFKAQLLSI